MEQSKYFTYCLIRCADEKRDESLNVGLFTIDERGAIRVRLTSDLHRIERALPHVSSTRLADYLMAFSEHLSSTSERKALTIDYLRSLAASWSNTVRLSNPRSIAGDDPDAVLESLFTRYVALPATPLARTMTDPDVRTHSTVTSQKVMRTVVKRLYLRGFREGEHLQRSLRVDGRTRSNLHVPVWFPLAVHRRLLVDSMSVKEKNEERSLDFARVLGAKTAEALRSESNRHVAIMIEPSKDSQLNTLVESVISDEANPSGQFSLYWTSDIDRFVATLPSPQAGLPLGLS